MASNRCRLKWAYHFIYALTGDEFQMAVVLRSLGPYRVVAGLGNIDGKAMYRARLSPRRLAANAGVEASGPHDFAVRFSTVRLRAI
jgi:hypothetical protein